MHLIHFMHNMCSRSRVSYSDLVLSPDSQTLFVTVVCSKIIHGTSLGVFYQEESSVGIVYEDMQVMTRAQGLLLRKTQGALRGSLPQFCGFQSSSSVANLLSLMNSRGMF